MLKGRKKERERYKIVESYITFYTKAPQLKRKRKRKNIKHQ